MKVSITPDGWPNSLEGCPPGHFMWQNGDKSWHLGFKTEYLDSDGHIQVYNASGEFFHYDGDVWPCSIKVESE